MNRKMRLNNTRKMRQLRGITYMHNQFKKVVYLESVNQTDDNVYEIQSMEPTEKGLKIILTDGKKISGAKVRYARECEQVANKRLPH